MLRETPGDKFQTTFDCQAEDADHAAEQAENAYPGAEITSTTKMAENLHAMQVSLDGGQTFVDAKDGVRIIYRGIPGEAPDTEGELHINATSEGLIHDFWIAPGTAQERISGTRTEMLGDILANLHND